MDVDIELLMRRGGESGLREEQKAELERTVRNGLVGDAGNFGSVNRVLRVEITEL